MLSPVVRKVSLPVDCIMPQVISNPRPDDLKHGGLDYKESTSKLLTHPFILEGTTTYLRKGD
jgi:hypothetical protein